jgi:hypothetical protein
VTEGLTSFERITMRLTILRLIAVTCCWLAGCGVNVKTPSTTVEVGPGGVKVEAPGTKVNVSPTEGVDVDTPGADVKVNPRDGVDVKSGDTDVKVEPKHD